MIDFLGGFVTGVLVGAAGTYYGDKFTDRRRKREAAREFRKLFTNCQEKMPELFAEMRNDLRANPLTRELVLMGENDGYIGEPVFSYFYEKHENLADKVRLLVSNGFVNAVPKRTYPRFQMKECFVTMLLEDAHT